MNIYKLFSSLISIVISIYFILLGIVCLFIPWIPKLWVKLTQLIIENKLAISLFGFIFLSVGAAILTYIITTSKQRYYRVRSGKSPIEVDEQLIQQYLDKYWKELFPDHEIPNHLQLKRNRIHLSVDLPFLPLPEQKPLLQRIESDLTELFEKVLGYRREFFISASFQKS